MSYTMDFVPASETMDDDETYDYESPDGQTFRVVCDPKSLLYIYGMQLDFSTALIGGGPESEHICLQCFLPRVGCPSRRCRHTLPL